MTRTRKTPTSTTHDRYLSAPMPHDRTKDKFTKVTVTPRPMSAKMPPFAPVECYAIGNFAVHRALVYTGAPTGHNWTVTHIPTGLGASGSPISINHRQARQLARAYHEHGPEPDGMEALTRHLKPVYATFFYPLFPANSRRAAELHKAMIDAQDPNFDAAAREHLRKIGAPLCPARTPHRTDPTRTDYVTIGRRKA